MFLNCVRNNLLQENEEDCHYEADEGGDVIPVQGLALEEYHHKDSKDRKGYNFLNDLELHQGERTSVYVRADAVRRDLQAIFKKCDAPGEEYHGYQRPGVRNVHLLKLEMTVPGYRHTDVGTYEQEYSPQPLHSIRKH